MKQGTKLWCYQASRSWPSNPVKWRERRTGKRHNAILCCRKSAAVSSIEIVKCGQTRKTYAVFTQNVLSTLPLARQSRDLKPFFQLPLSGFFNSNSFMRWELTSLAWCSSCRELGGFPQVAQAKAARVRIATREAHHVQPLLHCSLAAISTDADNTLGKVQQKIPCLFKRCGGVNWMTTLPLFALRWVRSTV